DQSGRDDEGRSLHRRRSRMPRLLRHRARRADQQRLSREHGRGEDGRAAAEPEMTDPIKVLTANIDKPNSASIDTYGDYKAARKALAMKPEDVVQLVKDSELRGRGGAGFPTGMKWSFVPKNAPKPTYLLCNADESEPGTFKDRVIIEKDPHLLLEGMLIAAYAIGSCPMAYIYIRGEFYFGAQVLDKALEEARAKG